MNVKNIVNNFKYGNYGTTLLRFSWNDNGNTDIFDIMEQGVNKVYSQFTTDYITTFQRERMYDINAFISEYDYDCKDDITKATVLTIKEHIFRDFDYNLVAIISAYILLNCKLDTISNDNLQALMTWVDNQLYIHGFNLPLNTIEKKIKELS